MAKLLENFAWGVLDSGVSDTDTTLDSSEFERLPVVEGGDTLTIILDPDESAGEPEIVYVTAHTADSSSVTVDRGEEDTTARSHGSNTKWVHSLTKLDLVTSTDLSDGLAEKLDLSGGTLTGNLEVQGGIVQGVDQRTSASGTEVIDLQETSIARLILDGDTTIQIDDDSTHGSQLTLEIRTSGYEVTWDIDCRWIGGEEPTLEYGGSGTGESNIITFVRMGGGASGLIGAYVGAAV